MLSLPILLAKKSVEDLLAKAVPLDQALARRPDLLLDPAKVQDLVAAVRKGGGRVSWPVEAVVDFLGLDESYREPDAKRTMLLAASLDKRLRAMHVPLKVGSAGRGKYLVLADTASSVSRRPRSALAGVKTEPHYKVR